MLERFSVRIVLLAIAAAFLTVFVAVPVTAQDKGESAQAKYDFMVVSPHTAEGCLAALDEIVGSGEGALDKWNWGCMAGDHTGYAVVKAADQKEALQVVPKSLRSQATAVKLNKFTAKQVESFHKMK